MIEYSKLVFKPALRSEAQEIAQMSRDLIETGLIWSWTTKRVLRAMQDQDTVVLAARDGTNLLGFAIMKFFSTEAHLNLIAVYPIYQRLGIGKHLLKWLEESARVAGTFSIVLEVRATRPIVQAFYLSQGYRTVCEVQGYYQGRETAVRMTKNLSMQAPA